MTTSSTTKSSSSASDSRARRQTVPVPPSDGFVRWRTTIVAGLVFLTVVYAIVYWLVESTSSGPNSIFKPAAQFCTNTPEGTTCSRPDLFAFQVSSAIMQLYMGGIGFWTWHISKNVHRGVSGTAPEGRLFAFLEEAELLNVGILIFQIWDFLASLGIPEHRTVVFLTHHVLAALTAYFSLTYTCVHYYALFFGGCSEISSIFLVLCDFDVYFPSQHIGHPLWTSVVTFCQTMFVLTFFFYRVVWWLKVSYHLWSDAYHVLVVNEKKKKKDDNDKYDYNDNYRHEHDKKSAFVYIFLAMDAILGVLQLYWFFWGIVPKAFEVLDSK